MKRSTNYLEEKNKIKKHRKSIHRERIIEKKISRLHN